MSKRTSRHVLTRSAAPIPRKEGKVTHLMCPHCKPTHSLSPSGPSACGTMIQVSAVQRIYRAKDLKGSVCIKCRRGGGDMVMFQQGFVHTHDCTPNVMTLTEKPKYSPLAGFAFNLPDGWLKRRIIKNNGTPTPVEEFTPAGERTGKILGYVFLQQGQV